MYLHCKCINVAVLSSCVRPKVLDDKDLYKIVAKQLSIMVYRAGCSIGDSTKHSFPIISHQITSTTPTRTYPPHHRLAPSRTTTTTTRHSTTYPTPQ